VQTEINAAIRRGVPVGGTSAGLAVLGEWVYSAEGDKPDDPNLESRTALANPFHPRIMLSGHFLDVPILKGTITDSHFVKRDRMGRLLTFLARLGRKTRCIGVDERTAVLVEPDGHAHIVGKGSVYFLQMKGLAEVLAPGKPLSFRDATVKKVSAGEAFDLKSWRGEAAVYGLSVAKGTIHLTQVGGAIY
jgi:cyanophycinase-like exopeptidase